MSDFCASCPVDQGICPLCDTFWIRHFSGKRIGVRPTDRNPYASYINVVREELPDRSVLEPEDVEVALAALAEIEAELARADEAQGLVSAYYAYHSDYGEVCPCDMCEKARPYFAAMLKAAVLSGEEKS